MRFRCNTFLFFNFQKIVSNLVAILRCYYYCTVGLNNLYLFFVSSVMTLVVLCAHGQKVGKYQKIAC